MTKKGKIAKFSVTAVMAFVLLLCAMSMLLAACGKVSISLDKTEAALYVGDSIKLTATVTGDDNAEIEWSTSDTAVATVRRGTVSATGVGSAVITAQLENGAAATCSVTVSERTVTISQKTAEINLDENNTLTLTATASDGGDVTWSTSDPSVASVNKGVVTAYDIGTVTITAQRGTAKDTCAITVTEPSRPADYYKITKLTNVEVVADPGVWHYHADGSMGGDYGFESDPLHKNSTATATLNVIPRVANGQYFYFRYQPDQVEVGQYYTMKLAITVSSSATLRLGSRGADNKFAGLEEEFVADTEKTVEYIGYRNESEPFSVRINSEVEADTVTLTVKLISVVSHDGTDLPDYHFHEEGPTISYEEIEKDTGAYDLEIKNNAGTVENPGKWFYNQGEGSVVTEAKYDNGTIVFNFDSLAVSGNNQLRYRPALDGETKIKVQFTVASNVTAKVVLALCDSVTFASEGWTEKTVTAEGTQTISAEFTIKNSQLIFIQVAATGEAQSNATFTFSDVKIFKEGTGSTEPVTPEEDKYTLTVSNNAGVVADPGKWYYICDGEAGTDYELVGVPEYDNGTIVFAFNKMAEGTPTYQLRYQPDMAVGTTYTITFTVEVSAAGKVIYGNDYKAFEFEEAGTQTLTWTGEVSASAPFMIQIRSTDRSQPITLTVTDIAFTAAE